MNLQLGVIFGGQSLEHEVSILSALHLLDCFNHEEVDVIPIYYSKDKRFYIGNKSHLLKTYRELTKIDQQLDEVDWIKKHQQVYLKPKHKLFKSTAIDLVFPILHGVSGEDGSIQGFFETLDIPYCEGSVFSCALIQDKAMMRKIFAYHQLPIVEGIIAEKNEVLSDPEGFVHRCEQIGGPWILKPAHGGSSIGIQCCDEMHKLMLAALECFTFDHKLVIEKRFVNFREFNIGVLGDGDKAEVSTIEEVFKSKEILSYGDKYGDSSSKGIESTSRKLPADISLELKAEIEKIALEAFKACECNGVVRIDFLYDEENQQIIINEINAIPGSLATYLFTGQYDKTALLSKVIHLALKRQRIALKEVKSIETSILKHDWKMGIKK